MKTKKKALLVVLAAVLLLSVSVLGTMAWLYDTEDATYGDIFTVGDVDITFAIDAIAEDGVANEWVPNQDYAMNPTITVKGGSEECYIRMIITISDAADLLNVAADIDKVDTDGDSVADIFLVGHYIDLEADQYYVAEGTNNWNDEEWFNDTRYNKYDAVADTLTYEFRLRETVAESDADTIVNGVFDVFTLPFYLNNEDVEALDEMTVSFEVQAMQAYEKGHSEKFSMDQAWAAYEAQVNLGGDVGLANAYTNGGSNASGWSDAE